MQESLANLLGLVIHRGRARREAQVNHHLESLIAETKADLKEVWDFRDTLDAMIQENASYSPRHWWHEVQRDVQPIFH